MEKERVHFKNIVKGKEIQNKALKYDTELSLCKFKQILDEANDILRVSFCTSRIQIRTRQRTKTLVETKLKNARNNYYGKCG